LFVPLSGNTPKDKLSMPLLWNRINKLNPLLLPTDAHNVKKRRVIKTF